MDLRNNTITLGELLANPRSRAVLHRRFGQLLSHPMAGAARPLTLAQLTAMADGRMPASVIRETLEELNGL